MALSRPDYPIHVSCVHATTDIAPFPVQAEPPIFSDYRPSTTVSTVVALGVQLSHMQGAVGILNMIRKHGSLRYSPPGKAVGTVSRTS